MEYILSLLLTMCETIALCLAADGMFLRKDKSTFAHYLVVCLSVVSLIIFGILFSSFSFMLKFSISILIMF